MDMSRESTCSYPLRECSLDHTLGALAAAGFSKVDLWGRPPHFSTDPLQVAPAHIEAVAARHAIAIGNLGSYPGKDFASTDAATVEAALAEMFATIDLAARFGARSIRVLPGSGDDPAQVPALIGPFRESAAYAQTKGVYLGMENHAGSIAGNPPAALRLCEGVGSKHFGVLYEPCNLMHGRVDYKEAFSVFKDWIAHVHVKDGAWVGETFERRHLGEGTIDYLWVVDALQRSGYEGDFALEYEICDIEPIETGLPKWYEYWERL